MYIKSARIMNIRSIEDFEINFENPAGWHVLIGDNGSGKLTIIRSIALALVGPDEAPGLRADWRDWLSLSEEEGRIKLEIEQSEVDKSAISNDGKISTVPNIVYFKRSDERVLFSTNKDENNNSKPTEYNWGNNEGWFSVAYGPYRRFTGGDTELDKIYPNQPKLGAHLSALNEAAALTEATKWLVKLNYKILEKYSNDEINDLININLKDTSTTSVSKGERVKVEKYSTEEKEAIIMGSKAVHSNLLTSMLQSFQEFRKNSILGLLETLINFSDFLPNNTKLEKISSDGVFFKDCNGSVTNVNQLSDGFRSILSLIFELIRQLIRVYGEETVFKNIRKNQENSRNIDLPGVVLIDEIDAHLHPTWQTKIGQWFLKYFPNIQFIVTTHSPLVCRAAEKGTIWKLAAPGSDEKSEQVTGVDRQRLIFGNILDAYGTEVFGEDVSRSEKSAEMLKELAALSVKSFKGKITDSERQRADQLKQILPTE